MGLTKQDKELIKIAGEKSKETRKLTASGEVGSALISKKGDIYFGVSIEAFCGIGTCGEHGAISSMIANGENEIKTIVAAYYDPKKKSIMVIPPCGRCRELVYQINKKNLNTWIIISKNKKIKLRGLLNYRWQECFPEGL